MDNPYSIQILPEANDFLAHLAEDLLRDGYKMNYAFASKMVDEIVDFIYAIPHVPHHSIPLEFQYHFERYGKDLKYVCFKRKSSPRTTWYFFFEQKDGRILVKHISNNWIEGHYLRESRP